MIYGLDQLEMLPLQINRILENPARAKRIAEEGQRKVLKNYSWELFVKNYIIEAMEGEG